MGFESSTLWSEIEDYLLIVTVGKEGEATSLCQRPEVLKTPQFWSMQCAEGIISNDNFGHAAVPSGPYPAHTDACSVAVKRLSCLLQGILSGSRSKTQAEPMSRLWHGKLVPNLQDLRSWGHPSILLFYYLIFNSSVNSGFCFCFFPKHISDSLCICC